MAKTLHHNALDAQLAPLTNAAWVPVGQVTENPWQPRRWFDETEMQELAASIKARGVLQPILVIRLGPERFQLVAGERRWRAATAAGLATVPAMVYAPGDLSETDQREIALAENVQRKSLTDREEATGMMDLWAAYEAQGVTMSQAEMQRRLNVSPSFVRHRRELLLTREDVQEVAARHRGVISSCLAINAVTDEHLRRELLTGVAKRRLSARDVQARIDQAQADAKWKAASQKPDAASRQAASAAQRRQREAATHVSAALDAIARQLANLEAWAGDVPPASWRPKAVQLHKRLGKLL